MAIVTSLLGLAALLGLGWFTSGLVSSLALPVAVILAVVAGVSFFVQSIRNDYMDLLGLSSESGQVAGGVLVGTGVFYGVFVLAQSLITSLSALAGLLVVGLVVALFFLPNSIIFQVIDLFIGDN